MLYGQFVGSWDIESTWYQPDGSSTTGKGEWHFDWILGGTGVQDVLFASGAPAHQYGTTLRCYDKAIDAWHLVWMQPASGEFAVQVADWSRPQWAKPSICNRRRWSFTEITPNSFRWRDVRRQRHGSEQEMWRRA
jgi:hypothetical protein